MHQPRMLRILGLGLLVAVLSPLSAGAQRQVDRREGVPLEQMVRDGDSELVVHDTISPGLGVLPGLGVTLLEWNCQSADLIAVVSVTETHGEIVETGDWVNSKATLTILELIKVPTLLSDLGVGASLEVRYYGGTVQVGRVRVRAVVPGFRHPEKGKTYLVFLNGVTDSAPPVLGSPLTYEVGRDGRLLRLSSKAETVRPEQDDLQGAALARVRDRLRQCAKDR